jgi:alpha-glutamyl/putrescinyl thymine pyrophosphorylase clade 1
MPQPNFAERSCVFDTYWHFAAERLNMFYRRLEGAPSPWTDDQILQAHRFTNVYRVTDRVSQYLVGEVQYGTGRSQAIDEVFFRTLLFKIFNKIETWEAIESELGPIGWQSANLERLDDVLHSIVGRGQSIYSAAYIMPSPAFGCKKKHSNHLRLLAKMMDDRLPSRISSAKSLNSVYEELLAYTGIGKFLAFQFAIDLNYSSIIDFPESEFVVAGPGAHDGISKCFPGASPGDAEQLIMAVAERQTEEFKKRGIVFPGLYGRPLQPIDCQNLFCEISKYSRVSHPEIRGVANRQRIKQVYRGTRRPIKVPFFPPKWNLRVQPVEVSAPTGLVSFDAQPRLL